MRITTRVLTTKLRVEINNVTRVFLETLDFEIEVRVLQKSEWGIITLNVSYAYVHTKDIRRAVGKIHHNITLDWSYLDLVDSAVFAMFLEG